MKSALPRLPGDKKMNNGILFPDECVLKKQAAGLLFQSSA